MSSERPSRVPEFGRPDAIEFAIGKKTHRVADVAPLDVSGVRTMLVGTIAWGIAAIVMLPFWSTLRDSGRSWWLWTALAGFGLGLLGLEYCRTRVAGSSAASETTQAAFSSAPKSKKFRLGSRKGSATDRLMEAAKPDALAPRGKAPDKHSLGRKHNLSNQSADEAGATPVKAKPTAKAEVSEPRPNASTDRPVGRRRKPE